MKAIETGLRERVLCFEHIFLNLLPDCILRLGCMAARDGIFLRIENSYTQNQSPFLLLVTNI